MNGDAIVTIPTLNCVNRIASALCVFSVLSVVLK